jgi:sugar phosphate permease
MTDADSKLLHHRTIFDHWKSLSIGLLFVVLLSDGFGYNGVFVMFGIASIAAMLVFLYVYLMLKKTIPALADAS